MKLLLPTTVWVGLGLTLRLVAANGSAGHFPGLLERSPFGQGPAGSDSTEAKSPVLEFRAYSQEGNRWFFSVFETTERSSNWVGLHQQKADIFIKSFDPEKLSVSVEYRGEIHTLALKGAKPFASVTIKQSPPTTLPPTENEAFHDRPFRIGHVAEELEIREAVRKEE